MPNKLVDLSIHEVSGVDAAANMRKFLIVKSAPGGTLKERLQHIVKQYLSKPEGAVTFSQAYAVETMDDAISDLMYDSTWALKDTIKSILQDASVADKANAVKVALNDFNTVVYGGLSTALAAVGVIGGVNESKEEGNMPISEEVMKGLPEEVQKEIVELQKQVAELQKSKDGGKEAVGKEAIGKDASGSGSGPKVEDVLKRLTPEAQLLIKDVLGKAEELEKRANSAEEQLKKMQDSAKLQEYVRKAESFKALPVKAAEFGPLLKTLADTNPEQVAALEKLLHSTDEMLQKSLLFKEIGTGVESNGAWSEIEKAAESIRQTDTKLTKEQAITKAIQDNPEIYKRWKEDQM